MKKLPVGIADFATIRKGGYYADKTKLLYKIIQWPVPYFLSRPRRFGKTVLVDSLEYLLRGQKELFKGLWIEKAGYDWPAYPVIRLEMNGVVGDDLEEVISNLSDLLEDLAGLEGLELKNTKPVAMFRRLITGLYNKYDKTKVAILIDEYDAPIIEHIANPDKADEIRKELKKFFGVLKTNVKMIGHIFITGISRFTKTSIFSELNNLKDITFNSEYAAICGLTEGDLADLLGEYQDKTLAALIERGSMPPGSTGKDLRNLIEAWYDGYTWDGKTKVYNPWSVLTFLDEAKIGAHWYETGSPTFLIELGRGSQVNLDLLKEPPNISEQSNAIDNIALLDPAVLLFQTGYLTIDKELPNFEFPSEYSLTIPNLEVRASLLPLTFSFKRPKNPFMACKLAVQLRDGLLESDALRVEKAFGDYLNQYPYDTHIENEKFYQAMLDSVMLLADQQFQTQEHTTHGRLDLHLTSKSGDEYIVEIKLYREKNPKNKKPLVPPIEEEAIAKLRGKMTPLAMDAFKQITERYQGKFTAGQGRVVKVALVIARRSFVLAMFEAVG